MAATDSYPVPDYPGLLRFDGKGHLIAGGGLGIGRQTAHALAACGAKVAVADVDPERVATAAAEVGGVALSGDLRERDEVERVVAEAELIAQEGDDQLALRVAVKAGGCSGMSYEIFFETDTDTEPEDHEVVFGTVKVRVDPASAPHLAGATLDYKDGLKDAGFHIENPNAQRSCGCGQSFA